MASSLSDDSFVPDNIKTEIAAVFSEVNDSRSRARVQKALPLGRHPLQLYSMATPNGQKVTILLEEIGADYDAYLIDITKGEQYTSGFVEINPNSRVPALLDKDGVDGKPLRVFESNSIMLYLAEKFGKFVPRDPRLKVECMNWLFFHAGSTPFFVEFGHFQKFAPEKVEYGMYRFGIESQRVCDVLDQRLEGRKYLLGDEYSIADMAWFPWIRCLDNIFREVLGTDTHKNVKAWMDRISERPAVKKGLMINSTHTEFSDGILEYHSNASGTILV